MLKPIDTQFGYGYRTAKRSRGSRRYLPRLVAFGLALIVITVFSWASICLITATSPVSRMVNAQHASGVIVAMNTQGFLLYETDGERLAFTCGQACQDSWPHLRRHLREHAHTD